MAKIYYNDNGTWKVVDISGGGSGGSSNVVESPLTIGTGAQTLKIHKAGYIEYTNPTQHMTLNFPFFSAQGNADLLSSANVKTLFGNQSIVGIGNIDLYVHNMTFTLPDGNCYGRWISSKNLNIDSLTDLKTVFGNTFKLPLFGDVPKSGGTAVMITETKLIMDDLDWNYSDFTISDIVTTV